jgi:hypothetical protein
MFESDGQSHTGTLAAKEVLVPGDKGVAFSPWSASQRQLLGSSIG